ncbi:MAG: hypothetical protein JJE46_16030 [Acidimicrobiia bacterium]|nr:hypothetical protein [Acidimicrobiia bacterium]
MLGGAFVVATLVATRWLGPDVGGATVSSRVVVALLLLWLAGTLAARVRRGRGLAGGLLAIPGGVLLASSVAGSRPWAAALLIVGPAIAGTGTADLDERLGSSGTAALAFAVALGGMYATVPDTELVRSGLGAATWITLLAWPFAVGRIGRGGAYGASGLFLWMALVAGAGRPGSTIGAAACLGMLIVEPLGRLLARPVPMRPTRPGITPPALIIAAQCALALYFSRVAGFQVLASHAALMALPALVAAVIVTIAVARTGTRARR